MTTAAVTEHHHDEEHPPEVIWSSKSSIGKLGILFFIGSEVALFASFFLAYLFIRVAGLADYSSWAEQIGSLLPMDIVTYNSIILFSSSVTIHYSEIALRRGSRMWQGIWLGLTIILGSIFLGIQVSEYVHLVGAEFLGPSVSAYSSVFYSLTGLHGFHVFVGIVLLVVMFVRTMRGHYGPAAEEHPGFNAMSIYWHFVDLVWIGVFGLIYIPGNWGGWDEKPIFFIGAAIIIVLMFLPNFIGKGAPKHEKA